MGNVISIKNLTKTYGKKRGVADVSFEVQEGEIFGFIGPNGAGKSTTIRSMLGFLRFDSGSIEILGMDAVKDHERILKEVGYMPSEALFYPAMKVSEVIKYAADVRRMDCRDEAAKLCERLQVDTSKRIKELSLGNRKKVSIVCAMQHRPRLFIFDEPTSGLDPLMQNTFFELIKEYVKEGTTCMLSTHVLPEVRKHCDRAAIMREGHLIKTDTVENLIKTSVKNVKLTAEGRTEEYIFKGDINELIRDLGQKNIQNLTIEEPSLEDMFMHFYEGEEEVK
ncbi:ABC transporter ATP-binding protein [Butyrivibrio sp. MC2021]|uniref:ABC transporter ATP-binding protein n=1 Tax=Butyrivibrio sp. MC2021 TaxID=1408306 RepID=UPI00047C5A58|nr:ABC transporter ATP-binding protein [Butyrivibrio sp. MC2021]